MRAVLCTVALLALAGQAFGILPLGDNGMTTYTGRKREPNTLVFGNQNWTTRAEGVGPSYLSIRNRAISSGEFFSPSDIRSAARVAVIGQTVADQLFSGGDPIGQTIQFGNMDGDLRLITIVGIVGDTHEYGLEPPPRPTVYVNLRQRPRPVARLALAPHVVSGGWRPSWRAQRRAQRGR